MSGPARQLKGRAARLVRMMPSGPSTAARTPFVLLVVLLLGGGLIALLVLNSAINEGSFRLSELKKRTTELTDEQQALQHDVDSFSRPDALERRARELGMVPGGSPAFLGPDGKVRGEPDEATAEPRPTPPPSKPVDPAPPTTPASPTTSDADPAATSPAPPVTAAPTSAAPNPTGTVPNPSAGPDIPLNQTPTSPGR
ncbi:septum formation initiator family protein [Streptomyces sp. NPDC052042]|uniref:septum formation initiator family protein n=1 Tax=Streptomyces sp. NPDC052042 TaxID=3365683 RepID=UPI0037D3634D